MKIMHSIQNRVRVAVALFVASTVACFADWSQYESHPACGGWPCCCYDCGGYEACGQSGAWQTWQCEAWCFADCGVPSASCSM